MILIDAACEHCGQPLRWLPLTHRLHPGCLKAILANGNQVDEGRRSEAGLWLEALNIIVEHVEVASED